MASIFVSHRGADAALAEALARELRAAGHAVWLDAWEVEVGDSLVERIASGLATAEYLVLCYSASGVDSSWMSREWMATLARQLDGKGVKILPVLLSGGEPPSILADIKFADLTSDWVSGIAQLLRVISGPSLPVQEQPDVKSRKE